MSYLPIAITEGIFYEWKSWESFLKRLTSERWYSPLRLEVNTDWLHSKSTASYLYNFTLLDINGIVASLEDKYVINTFPANNVHLQDEFHSRKQAGGVKTWEERERKRTFSHSKTLNVSTTLYIQNTKHTKHRTQTLRMGFIEDTTSRKMSNILEVPYVKLPFHIIPVPQPFTWILK